mmetsp:Transcript_14213/g.24344  ORF Transcript_14213/g.24344 Transcript_14213/m.24344 type:complete len:97 (+) Transcript_14213:640-930(+)
MQGRRVQTQWTRIWKGGSRSPRKVIATLMGMDLDMDKDMDIDMGIDTDMDMGTDKDMDTDMDTDMDMGKMHTRQHPIVRECLKVMIYKHTRKNLIS